MLHAAGTGVGNNFIWPILARSAKHACSSRSHGENTTQEAYIQAHI